MQRSKGKVARPNGRIKPRGARPRLRGRGARRRRAAVSRCAATARRQRYPRVELVLARVSLRVDAARHAASQRVPLRVLATSRDDEHRELLQPNDIAPKRNGTRLAKLSWIKLRCTYARILTSCRPTIYQHNCRDQDQDREKRPRPRAETTEGRAS